MVHLAIEVNRKNTSMQQTDVVLVLTNTPDEATAKRFAQLFVEESLAACVNIGALQSSVYVWEGALQQASEIPLTIKTTWGQQQAVVERLVSLHPYTVPEVLVVPVIAGFEPYMNWVRQATGSVQP